MSALIEASGVTRAFGSGTERVVALDDVALTIRAGEFVAIVGKSGAGKSTFLQLIGALDRGYTGSLKIDGQELRTLDDAALSTLRNQKIGFVFQSFNLLANLDVGANLVLPATFGGHLSAKDAAERGKSLLDSVGLAHKWRSKPLTLSGGERQRVAIARALLLRPPILICDEPTGALDQETGDGVMALFEDVRRQTGCALIMVTHDPAVARRAERIVELAAGKVVSETAGDSNGGPA